MISVNQYLSSAEYSEDITRPIVHTMGPVGILWFYSVQIGKHVISACRKALKNS